MSLLKRPKRKVVARTVRPRPRTYWVVLKLDCGHELLLSAGGHPDRYGHQKTAGCWSCDAQAATNPAKITDSRYADYEAKFGTESWELDALEPAVLVQLIRT